VTLEIRGPISISITSFILVMLTWSAIVSSRSASSALNSLANETAAVSASMKSLDQPAMGSPAAESPLIPVKTLPATELAGAFHRPPFSPSTTR